MATTGKQTKLPPDPGPLDIPAPLIIVDSPDLRRSPMSADLRAVRGTIQHSTAPVANDIGRYCKIPAGAIVVGGFFCATPLDTAGTPLLQIDIGYEVVGSGVQTIGFAHVDFSKTENQRNGLIFTPLISTAIAQGGALFTSDTYLISKVIVTPGTFAAGYSSIIAYYFVP